MIVTARLSGQDEFGFIHDGIYKLSLSIYINKDSTGVTCKEFGLYISDASVRFGEYKKISIFLEKWKVLQVHSYTKNKEPVLSEMCTNVYTDIYNSMRDNRLETLLS